MSHLRTCSIKVKNPNSAVLKAAVELVAKDLGTELKTTFTTVTSIRDYYNKHTKVEAGIKDDVHIPNGYGVQVEGGELKAVGDEFNQRVKLDKFNSMVAQAYKVIAYSRSLARQGYHTQVQRKGTNYVVVGEHS